MIKSINYLSLTLFLLINWSCSNTKASNEQSIESITSTLLNTETLKFTSGIRCILHDSKGNYWLGSHREGVCMFDGNTFNYFSTEDGLADLQVRSIQEDQKGNIWFGTANGVSSYDGQVMKNHTPKSGLMPSKEWAKTEEDLWFNAGNQTGVYRYNGDEISFLSFPATALTNPNNAYLTTCFSKGSKQMIWIGTYAGVFGYDGIDFTVINDETLKQNGISGSMHVRSIFEDSQGRLWIGNNGIGVLLYEEGKMTHFSEEQQLIHPLSMRSGDRSPPGTLEHVFAINEDAEGNIWFGDRDTGIWKYDGRKMTNYSINDQHPTPMPWCIYRDRNEQMLFGMAEGGVYRYSGQTFEKIF